MRLFWPIGDSLEERRWDRYGSGLSRSQIAAGWHCKPTTVPSHAIQKLGGQKYFAKVDNLWGYHQLRLEAESSKITAIITPWGVYRFLACPFGISIAPGEYQARMAHHILQDYYLNGAVVYIDNTILNGKNEERSWLCSIKYCRS